MNAPHIPNQEQPVYKTPAALTATNRSLHSTCTSQHICQMLETKTN